MESKNENYKEKYLEYKQKYLALKQSVGTTLNRYILFTNETWRKYILNMCYNSQHVFLNDIGDVKRNSQSVKLRDRTAVRSINIKKYFHKGKCHYFPKKILPEKTVKDLYALLTNSNTSVATSTESTGVATGNTSKFTWSDIEKKLATFYNYLLYSNVKLKDICKKFKEKNIGTKVINVLILGAGPTGLYTANYLMHHLFTIPKVNVLVIDNRIAKEGYRLPFTRSKPFGINFKIFTDFYPEIICMTDLVTKGVIEIKYLENLLLVLAYGNNIPIYFTDTISTIDEVKKFCEQNLVDVVYDCTGGRSELLTNLLVGKKEFYPADIKMETDNYTVVTKENESKLIYKNNYMLNRYYAIIEFYDDKGAYVFKTDYYDINDRIDLEFLQKFNGICLKCRENRLSEIVELFDKLNDAELSKKIMKDMVYGMEYSFTLQVIEPKLYHKLVIGGLLKHKNGETAVIGCGDTIFSSHFVIGAGLNRMLTFTNSILWYVQSL